jgi:DNA-binding PadR family transcriptional regulator
VKILNPEILSSLLSSYYKREIILLLKNACMETPMRICTALRQKGYEKANKQNVSINLGWLKENGLIKIAVNRRKGKLYQITDKGMMYVDLLNLR